MTTAYRKATIELVELPGGSFRMGSTPAEAAACVEFWGERLFAGYSADEFARWIAKETPAHTVELAPFAMAKYPVTNALYKKYAETTGSPIPLSIELGAPDDHPVWGVAYEEAERFADWLGTCDGVTYAVPTEAQWEYAARGPAHAEYPFGDTWRPECCNTMESRIGGTTPVDRYERYASGYGIVDLAGNVEEWTSSYYLPYRAGAFVDDHLTASNPSGYRVLRGGYFLRGGDLARCARRHGPLPHPEFVYRGFRLVRARSIASRILR
jgi:formylglycine-generating enzyme required for sulfatase activity